MKHCNKTYYQIVDKNDDMRDHGFTNFRTGIHKFETEEEARKYIETIYTNRSRGDGHDDYWRNKTQIVIKVTIENLN